MIRYLLAVTLAVLLPFHAGHAVEFASESDVCASTGGTWDVDHMRPNGHCIRDTAAMCSARGGKWTRVCMAGALMCVVPTVDANKACRSGRDCKQGCLDVGNEPDAEGLITGRCKSDTNPCGSFYYIEDGKRAGTIHSD